ncbi:hypothetical protein Oweho_2146 [Owenweeksia hongkongensis DSM 17368]|uniref:Outer membrane protein beta-barrel domain-containing protein n=1 Tax=Owenweeksia hongkongensis (strain DSM 17368 / CIP 108786 / JCM 12287 / NRRL B-23963 / UST20020801) TaxID=926562 RepID=G8R453_OWEHD|nr:TonB-dependent receptor [Owenweeksia hongkongensis]AEV33120.1 hypothetical protein Oweho_2146 [Owenweeksia hongkongensis DSM 17368]
MYLKTLLIFVILLFAINTFGQKLRIEGTVKDTANTPLEMANIIALSAADTSMLGYAFSDDRGRYRISVDRGEAYFLRFSYLGFEQQEITFTVKESDETVVQNIVMTPLNNELQEVEVVEDIPITVSGDTISYKAEAFTTGQERKLEDVLEQLPGFEVDKDGQVKVQGKNVEKVMVEGRDFFDGDTKLATKNIPANAVDKVQVLRNYNDVSPMQGVDNDDRIALNIKLKEGKKNIFFGDMTAEGGLDERYLLHPNLFYYSPKFSVNFIGDINNVGEPAFTAQDYFRFSGGFRNFNMRSGSSFRFGQDNIGVSTTSNNRAEEITSKLGAFNFSYNPSKKWSVTGFVIGSQTKTLSSNLTNRKYLQVDTNDLTEVLSTNNVQNNKSGLGKVSVTYTPNKEVHISYDAFGKISEIENVTRQSSDYGIITNGVNSADREKPYSIQQKLEAYWETDNGHLFSFEGQQLHKLQNPTLALSSDLPLFIQVIPPADSLASPFNLIQYKEVKTNKYDASLNYYYLFSKTTHLNFTIGVSHTDQIYNSYIEEELNDGTRNLYTQDDLNNNDVKFSLTDLYGSAHYKVKLGKFILTPGLNYHVYNLNDTQNGRENPDTRQFLLPDFFARYDFKKSERIQLDYKMQAEFTDINNVINGTVISSYNSLFRGNPEITNALVHQITLAYYNINLFNFTNIFGGVNYSLKERDITNVVVFDNTGLGRINTPINTDGINQILAGFGRIEKRFGKLKADVGANVALSDINNQVNGEANESESVTQNYSAGLSTNFKKAPNLDLTYSLIYNDYTGAGVSNSFVTHSPSIEVEAAFWNGFTFRADYTYNLYKAGGGLGTSEYDFLNAGLYYLLNDGPWEFSIRSLNLLGEEIIRQDAFNDFFVSTTRYNVLPRYVLVGVKFGI